MTSRWLGLRKPCMLLSAFCKSSCNPVGGMSTCKRPSSGADTTCLQPALRRMRRLSPRYLTACYPGNTCNLWGKWCSGCRMGLTGLVLRRRVSLMPRWMLSTRGVLGVDSGQWLRALTTIVGVGAFAVELLIIAARLLGSIFPAKIACQNFLAARRLHRAHGTLLLPNTDVCKKQLNKKQGQ
eukprot:COSAG01_NODE_70_length_28755_cov_34.709067_25_plen_182_part_00